MLLTCWQVRASWIADGSCWISRTLVRLIQCCSASWIECVAVRWMMGWYHWVFFFYWHYNPLWILAFSVILFHSALSSHCFLHRLIPIICISSSTSIIHLFLGLPLILVPIGFHSNILLGVLLSSIRITWPSQAILLLFINLTMRSFISSFSS